MAEYLLVSIMLMMLLLAFIPAIIASFKKHRFFKWYIFSLFFFPIAFVCSVKLKNPISCVGIYFYDKNFPLRRKKKLYRRYQSKSGGRRISLLSLFSTFFSKLVFSVLVAMICFALSRTFLPDTALLRTTCALFAVIFAILLSITENFKLSRLPLIADEITKRAIFMLILSVICSLPIYLIKTFVLDNIIRKYSEFMLFVCCLGSFSLFVILLLSYQRQFYTMFDKFFDYCTVSLFAYLAFAAMTLIGMSLLKRPSLSYLFAMPMQIFNLSYLDGVKYVGTLNYIYSAATVHLFIFCIIWISGLLCRNFKNGEFERRIEYRSNAFRMSQKRILRKRSSVRV